jgi:hypothetical protein
MNKGAMSILPANAKTMEMKPQSMLDPVMRFAKLNIDANIIKPTILWSLSCKTNEYVMIFLFLLPILIEVFCLNRNKVNVALEKHLFL